MMPRTLAAVSLFSSSRAYLFLNFLPPFSLRLISTLIMLGSTFLQTTPPRSHFLMCKLPLFAFLQRMAEPTSFLPPLFPSSEMYSFCGTSIAITPSGTQEVLPIPWGGSIRLGHLFCLPPLNDPDIRILLHRSSHDISFAPSSLVLSCSWEMLQDLGSDRLIILLFVLFSPVFCPNQRPPCFNFPKARWDDFPLDFDSHCLQRNTRLYLFLLLLLSLPLWH